MINFAINRIKAQTIIRKSPENFIKKSFGTIPGSSHSEWMRGRPEKLCKEVLWNNSAGSAAGTAAGKIDDLVFSGGFL